MKVVGSILFVVTIRLVGPVDADFLVGVSLGCDVINAIELTDWWTRRPLRVVIALSAAPGSSYSTKP